METTNDTLCRALNANEQQWLASLSLICIAAKLSTQVSEDQISERLAVTRSIQPFLSVSIDTTSLKFARSSHTPFTH